MKRKILCFVTALLSFFIVEAQQPCTLTLEVSAVTGEDMAGTPFHLERVESGLIYDRVLGENGTYTINNIYSGIHHLVIEKEGLKTYDNSALDIKGDTVLKIKLEEPVRTPYNLQSVFSP